MLYILCRGWYRSRVINGEHMQICTRSQNLNHSGHYLNQNTLVTTRK